MFVLLFVVIACGTREKPLLDLEIHIDEITLVEQLYGFSVDIRIDGNFPDISTYDEVIFGLFIAEGLHESADSVKEASSVIHLEEVSKESNMINFTYTGLTVEDIVTVFSFLGYVTFRSHQEETTIYVSEIPVTSMVSLAKTDDSHWAEHIQDLAEQRIVRSVDINFYPETYEVEYASDRYTVSVKTDYNTVEITVILEPGMIFHDDVALIINDVMIPFDDYTVMNDTLIYVFEDPNWTGYY